MVPFPCPWLSPWLLLLLPWHMLSPALLPPGHWPLLLLLLLLLLHAIS
jgi:hypothetical protein